MYAFTEESARKLARCLPCGLQTLILRLNGHGDAFLRELSSCHGGGVGGGGVGGTRGEGGGTGASDALGSLFSLDLTANRIGKHGLMAMNRAIKGGGFLSKLSQLTLDRNLIGDFELGILCNKLADGALGAISDLSLNDNQISDEGIASVIELMGKPLGVRNLSTLSLRGNLASSKQVFAVQRILAASGRGQTVAPDAAGAPRKRPEQQYRDPDEERANAVRKSMSIEQLNSSAYEG